MSFRTCHGIKSLSAYGASVSDKVSIILHVHEAYETLDQLAELTSGGVAWY